MMEIDALYCGVIVRRWEEFIGRKAVRSVRFKAKTTRRRVSHPQIT